MVFMLYGIYAVHNAFIELFWSFCISHTVSRMINWMKKLNSSNNANSKIVEAIYKLEFYANYSYSWWDSSALSWKLPLMLRLNMIMRNELICWNATKNVGFSIVIVLVLWINFLWHNSTRYRECKPYWGLNGCVKSWQGRAKSSGVKKTLAMKIFVLVFGWKFDRKWTGNDN